VQVGGAEVQQGVDARPEQGETEDQVEDQERTPDPVRL
jgi:hypothetical protein